MYKKNHWTRMENPKPDLNMCIFGSISEMALHIGERIDYSIMVLGEINYQHRGNRFFSDH